MKKIFYDADLFKIATCKKKSNSNINLIQPKISIKPPYLSIFMLFCIIFSCTLAPILSNHDPTMFYLQNLWEPPNHNFYFGTDSLGRDIYSLILYGGQISLFIGLFSALLISIIAFSISFFLAIIPKALADILLRLIEILNSIPSILLLILISSLLKNPTPIDLSIIISSVLWFPLSRIIYNELIQIKNTLYYTNAKLNGVPIFNLIFHYFLPNIWTSLIFMLISNISIAIIYESTLSFLGLGLPVNIISWGSVLSLSSNALLTNSWWIIVFPGLYIIITLLSITNICQYLKKYINYKYYHVIEGD